MNEPELFDIIELLVNVPDRHCAIGSQGTIVECLDENHFEVEFLNENGETTALCTLSSQEFIVVWKSQTKQWLTASEKAIELLDRLSDEKREEVLDFARFLIQKTENLATGAKNAIGNI